MSRRFAHAPYPSPEPESDTIPATDTGLALCEVDAAGRVSRWSPGAEALLGWGRFEAVGRRLPAIPKSEAPAFAHLLQRTVAGASFHDWPTLCRRRDGTSFPAAVASARLDDLNGGEPRIVLVIGSVHDAADQHAQIQAYAQDLHTSYARELGKTRALEESYLETVMALASAIEAKDGYTGAHVRRVTDLGLLLARQLDPAAAEDPQLAYGFLLHDIGKLSLPDAILGKPGALDPAEWAQIARHPEEGARILSNIPFLNRALDIVLHHHERWDGAGYPGGLAGEEIPSAARLFAVADTVDAITSDRPYRSAASVEHAIEEIVRHSATQFDPAAVDALVALDPAQIQATLHASDA